MLILRLLAQLLGTKVGATVLVWLFQFVLKGFIHKRSRAQFIDALRRSYYELTAAAFSLVLAAFRDSRSRFRTAFSSQENLIWGVSSALLLFVLLFVWTYHLYKKSSGFPRETNWRDYLGLVMSVGSLIVAYDVVGTDL